MTIRKSLVLFISLLCLVLFSISAMAQSQTTGRIAGVVTDEKGDAVPGAQITVTNNATGESRDAVADDSGHYIVPLLPPGSYTVTASATGFKKFITENVKVAITETNTLNATLQVGAITETVVVHEEESFRLLRANSARAPRLAKRMKATRTNDIPQISVKLSGLPSSERV